MYLTSVLQCIEIGGYAKSLGFCVFVRVSLSLLLSPLARICHRFQAKRLVCPLSLPPCFVGGGFELKGRVSPRVRTIFGLLALQYFGLGLGSMSSWTTDAETFPEFCPIRSTPTRNAETA